MRFTALVPVVVMVPALAIAQSDNRSTVTGAPQATSVGARSATAPSHIADEPAISDGAGRVLVLECPAPSRIAEPGRADSVATPDLIALLCARAQLSHRVASENPRSLVALLDSVRAGMPAHLARDAHGAHETTHEAEATQAGVPVEPQLRLHMFADIRYSATDSTGSKNGFALGQFDLFARSQLSDNLSVLSELVLTAMPKNTFNTKLERLLLTFAPSDRFIASIGRFHTGVGYYNAAYHHGTWFQTAVGRPLIFATDGDIGFVPIHTLGISANGDIPSGVLGLRYVAELGSGRAGQSSAAVAPQPSLNDNNTPSINVGLIARPDHIDGLQVGASYYVDRLSMQDTSKSSIGESIAAVHALYKTDAVELLSEGVLMRHRVRGAVSSNDARGYYAQASRRIANVRPYMRWDYMDVPSSDPLFSFLGRRSGPTIGVRYDFDALAAVKLQGSHLNQTTRPTMNRVDAQIAFMF